MSEVADLDVVVERLIQAAPIDVFDAYVSPEIGKVLFAADPSWKVEVTCDLRVGGRWEISTGPAGVPPFLETNVFTEIDRPRRLAFTSNFASPDGFTFDRDVEVTFESAGNGTLMTMAHRGFPNAGIRKAFADSLPSVMDGIARSLRG
jgi:uncharacterized protein YndB with AHSA1/START domain